MYISSTLVAVLVLPATLHEAVAKDDGPVVIDSCPKQDACIEWTMKPATETCEVATDEPECIAMWQVCLTINRKGAGSLSGCPKAMARSTCAKEGCPSKAAPIFVDTKGCGRARVLPYTECQYGKPGESLQFFVQDGATCAAAASSNMAVASWTHEGGDVCEAMKKCHPKPPGVLSCMTAESVAKLGECVHEVTLPETCGKCSGDGGIEVESMPAAANDALMNPSIDLASSSEARAVGRLLSNPAVALASGLCITAASVAAAVTCRRVLPAPRTAEESRALEEPLSE
eukprot:CAMPEP_0170278326 /NCGR_PEP_ID=MMETSP0116_2-20130129/39168_1 /TAXON_ID=400756 /ORGANISM="Durinskia baltica, Strain CSIRO CS-38" /LENGTH=286 /DNA_ID=CAMNT_0010529639 /DNA_START=26 /DNA_END=886 /DNA_ORIENTATION=-